MKDLVAQILEIGHAPLILDEVKAALEEEQQKRHEFYEMIGEDDKAEFVNGHVIMHSPVKKQHSDASQNIFSLMKYYVQKHQLGYVGYEKIMISLTRNDYEPDVCFFKKEKSKDFTKKQMLFPTPDFVIEVLSSNVNHDRIIKYNDYEAHGIEEYWIIDADSETVEQYLIKNGQYELQLKAQEGHITSQAIEGFKIPIRAIFDEEENFNTLQEMLTANN